MLDWFRRRKATLASAARKPSAPSGRPANPQRSAAAARAAARAAEPPPLPEVVAEGNTQADWSVWEDSMTALDSQLGNLGPSSRIQVRDTRPSQLDEIDAFAKVGRKRDI